MATNLHYHQGLSTASLKDRAQRAVNMGRESTCCRSMRTQVHEDPEPTLHVDVLRIPVLRGEDRESPEAPRLVTLRL